MYTLLIVYLGIALILFSLLAINKDDVEFTTGYQYTYGEIALVCLAWLPVILQILIENNDQ